MTPTDLNKIFPTEHHIPIWINFNSTTAMKRVARYFIEKVNPGLSEAAIDLSVSEQTGQEICKKFYTQYRDHCEVLNDMDGEITGFKYFETASFPLFQSNPVFIPQPKLQSVTNPRSVYLHSPPKTPPKTVFIEIEDNLYNGDSLSFEGV